MQLTFLQKYERHPDKGVFNEPETCLDIACAEAGFSATISMTSAGFSMEKAREAAHQALAAHLADQTPLEMYQVDLIDGEIVRRQL